MWIIGLLIPTTVAKETLYSPRILIQASRYLDIPNYLVSWISDFLGRRKQYVKIGRHKSSVIDIWGNVPKETLLCIPLLVILINNIYNKLPPIKPVDDTTPYALSKSQGTTLQEAATKLESWLRNSQTTLNASKHMQLLIIMI